MKKMCLFCGIRPPYTKKLNDPDATLCKECWEE